MAFHSFWRKKAKNSPIKKYTYGYKRFSVLGGFITNIILVFGSVAVIVNAVLRILNPTPINYNLMIFLAVIGVLINLIAAYVTHGGHSINQRAVNLHMLEDVLGWITVLTGALIMRFTDFYFLDPLLSVSVALFILFEAFKGLWKILDLFLMKAPEKITVADIENSLKEFDAHHIHIFSIDGEDIYVTLHANGDLEEIKHKLEHLGITHSTVQIENNACNNRQCETVVHHHRHH